MSRSRSKIAIFRVSKAWYHHMEKALRRKFHMEVHEIEIDWDPDRDFDEWHGKEYKKLKDWGTWCGWKFPPSEDELDCYGVPLIETYKKGLRK